MKDEYWHSLGIDYGPGKNAFQAASESRPAPNPLTKAQQRDKENRAAALIRYKQKQLLKKAMRVNKDDFHIPTKAQTLLMQDKRRKLVSTGLGGV